MKISSDIVDALRRIPNKLDFCARYEIPPRTIYNLLEPGYSANRATILVVTMALQGDGLLATPKRRKGPKA